MILIIEGAVLCLVFARGQKKCGPTRNEKRRVRGVGI